MSLSWRDGREGGGATDVKMYTNSIMHRHNFLGRFCLGLDIRRKDHGERGGDCHV